MVLWQMQSRRGTLLALRLLRMAVDPSLAFLGLASFESQKTRALSSASHVVGSLAGHVVVVLRHVAALDVGREESAYGAEKKAGEEGHSAEDIRSYFL